MSRMLEDGRYGRSPHFAAKKAAQSSNAQASDFDYPAMQVALGQGRAKKMIVVGFVVGVVVAMNGVSA